MAVPRAVVLSFTKSQPKLPVPSVNSKTLSSMDVPFLFVRIVSKEEGTMVVDTTEEVEAEADIIVTTTPTCKAHPLKRVVNSLLETSRGRQDGVNSKITSANAVRLIGLKLLKVVMDAKEVLVL